MSYALNSTNCYFDRNPKRPSDAFCISCYVSLPQSYKDALNTTYGGQDALRPDRPKAYVAAWKSAARWLRDRAVKQASEVTLQDQEDAAW